MNFYQISWDTVREQISEDDDFSESQKIELLEHINYLAHLIGDRVFDLGYRHPLLQYVLNTAPWTRRWFWDLSIKLRKISNCINFQSVIKRLLSTQKFYEVLSVADIAYAFSELGFEVTLDPKVIIDGRQKEPDIQLINPLTDEVLYVEVSGQSAGKSERQAIETFNGLKGLFMFDNDLDYVVDIQKILDPKDIETYRIKLELLAQQSKTNMSFEKLQVEGVLNAGFAPRQKKSLVENWSKALGLRTSYSGPFYQLRTLPRLKKKIFKEVKQLPRDIPGMVFIRSPYIYSISPNYNLVIKEMAEVIKAFPNIYCLVLCGPAYYDGETFERHIGEHLVIRKKNDFLLGLSDIIIVRNKWFLLKISDNSIKKINQGIIAM